MLKTLNLEPDCIENDILNVFTLGLKCIVILDVREVQKGGIYVYLWLIHVEV